jgi:hypothetical protein
MDGIFLVIAMLFCPWLHMYTWSGWILIDSNSGYTVFEMYYLVLDINRCQELCDTEDRSTDFYFQFYISLYIDQTEDRFLENIGNYSFRDIMKDS